ncbi:hypothetical protein [Propioniciclava sp.]|uniref:hypothetical protein n=1 Tax=Propioniciclava sp. TaxID=2038686 RepID=UPI002610DAA1|nr:MULTISPECIES: hypothetical protein [Propionibacteriales]
MKTSSSSFPRGRLIALIAAGLALLILAGVGIYGLILGPRTTSTPAPEPAPSTSHTPTTPGPSSSRLPVVPRSVDPETFARNVAEAIFAWDTTSALMPVDYTAAILDIGDPSGTEQAGLASDLATYLPTRDAWIELRKHETRQHLTIDQAVIPEAWADAVAQAQPGQIAPGTAAYTIEGTRHRDGLWNGEAVTSEHAVSFTVFIVCTPAYPTCHLLRLSQLDNPLR